MTHRVHVSRRLSYQRKAEIKQISHWPPRALPYRPKAAGNESQSDPRPQPRDDHGAAAQAAPLDDDNLASRPAGAGGSTSTRRRARQEQRRDKKAERRARYLDTQLSQFEVPSRFLTPLFEAPLRPRVALAATPGKVHVAPVIDMESRADKSSQASVLDMPLNTLTWRDPLDWLALGWEDFKSAPLIGLFYGACFVLMGWLLLACFHWAAAYTLVLSAGFMLMGPFMCLGLYEVSRRIGKRQAPSFVASLTAWRRGSGQLGIFAGVLLVLEMLWGRAALIVFAVSLDGLPDFSRPVTEWMTGDMLGFIAAYLAVGAAFAALIYAISAISMPMMLDREVDAISAGLASMRLVTTQPGVMLWWAAIMTGLVIPAMLPGFLGLFVVGPVLGHASWHAYRAATARRPPSR